MTEETVVPVKTAAGLTKTMAPRRGRYHCERRLTKSIREILQTSTEM
ncbi:MAG: hypothetical protein ACLVAT_01950 [Lachnospiraceae bacterium]